MFDFEIARLPEPTHHIDAGHELHLVDVHIGGHRFGTVKPYLFRIESSDDDRAFQLALALHQFTRRLYQYSRTGSIVVGTVVYHGIPAA